MNNIHCDVISAMQIHIGVPSLVGIQGKRTKLDPSFFGCPFILQGFWPFGCCTSLAPLIWGSSFVLKVYSAALDCSESTGCGAFFAVAKILTSENYCSMLAMGSFSAWGAF